MAQSLFKFVAQVMKEPQKGHQTENGKVRGRAVECLGLNEDEDPEAKMFSLGGETEGQQSLADAHPAG